MYYTLSETPESDWSFTQIIRWRSISMTGRMAFLQFDWWKASGFASLRIFPYEVQFQISFKTEEAFYVVTDLLLIGLLFCQGLLTVICILV